MVWESIPHIGSWKTLRAAFTVRAHRNEEVQVVTWVSATREGTDEKVVGCSSTLSIKIAQKLYIMGSLGPKALKI